MKSVSIFTRVVATGAALSGVIFVLFALWCLNAGTANPYGAGVLALMGGYLLFRGLWALRRQLGTAYDYSAPEVTFKVAGLDERLTVIDRLRQRGMITEAEYAAKRQQILERI